MANRILAGYMAPNDAGKLELILDHDGPTSYNNTGTFTTSGEQINASDFGLGGFELIDASSVTSDGTGVVEVVLGATVAGGLPPPAPPVGNPGSVYQTAVLHWFTNVGRTEVTNATNLSGRYVRLRIVGV